LIQASKNVGHYRIESVRQCLDLYMLSVFLDLCSCLTLLIRHFRGLSVTVKDFSVVVFQ